MDEVDGMSSGDRGGMAELITLIKKTQVPILCLCNDASHQKIRSLITYCLHIPFRRYLSYLFIFSFLFFSTSCSFLSVLILYWKNKQTNKQKSDQQHCR